MYTFIKKYCFFILAFFCTIVIFWFSNQPASVSKIQSNETFLLLDNIKILHYFFKVVPIRKCAHIFLYLVLGLFCSLGFFKKIKHSYLCTYIVCYFYACFDELHQYFIDGRSSLFTDTLIDELGVLLGCFLSYISLKVYYKYFHKEN